MRLLLSLLAFVSLSAYAADGLSSSVVTLAPGASALVQPGQQTVQITCAATGPIKCTCAKQVSGKFCARYYSFTEGDFYCAGPGTTSSMFVSVDDCQLALPSIPVCY